VTLFLIYNGPYTLVTNTKLAE